MQFTKGGTEQQHMQPPEEVKALLEKESEADRAREAALPQHMRAENYDPKSLYERLEEQKAKKQEDFENMVAFKNQIRGLDDEEMDFIRNTEREREEMEARRWEQELDDVGKYREEVMKYSVDITAPRPMPTNRPARALTGKGRSKNVIAALVKPKDTAQKRQHTSASEDGPDCHLQPSKKTKATAPEATPDRDSAQSAPENKGTVKLASQDKADTLPSNVTSTATQAMSEPPALPLPSSVSLLVAGYGSDDDTESS